MIVKRIMSGVAIYVFRTGNGVPFLKCLFVFVIWFFFFTLDVTPNYSRLLDELWK